MNLTQQLQEIIRRRATTLKRFTHTKSVILLENLFICLNNVVYL